VRQFKYRPIAWYVASRPVAPSTASGKRARGASRQPAFECLVYYHACRGDVLARIRTQYVGPLIRAESGRAVDARRTGNDVDEAVAAATAQELEDFAGRLRQVEENGFACAELDKLLSQEPLDRWSGDWIMAPRNRNELLANERAWHVDINDGVRVNIAPIQLAGLLASDVLKAADAQKAISDRARWRSDERRWVREGVLQRSGWMEDDVPESPAWTRRAPEQKRLAEKRCAVLERAAATDPGTS
jgi:hypothetical protein